MATETETDGAVEVLRQIRDELRNVRTELVAEMRSVRSGVRTEVVDRAARWRMAAMASSGAVAFVALILAVRAGRQPTTLVMPAPVVAAAAPASPVAPAPIATPAPVAAAPALAAAGPAPKVAPEKVVSKLAAVAPVATPAPAVARRRAKPAAPQPVAETAAGDDDETMTFSPPPRRVRVHKMSYGPVESEPAKL